ncbi:MAG: DNA polymerase III subunit delta [Elusimicrobia bacterium]|nr:DNA polymerase III subunit delta [Elusimicrobiota bacterium]
MIIKYQDFKTKLKSLKKNELSPVYLFYGYENYLKNEIITHIEKLIIEPSIKEFNYSIFHLPDKESAGVSIESILQTANSYPFMSDKKLVIIKNINKLSASQDDFLENYIDNPSKTTCLILVGGDKLPKRNIFSKIENLYPTINFYHLFEPAICQWIIGEFRAFKKNISYPSAEKILAITGINLADIKQEIDKLVLYIDQNTEVTIEDVNICCGHYKENTTFELLPILAKKEIDQAMSILINLFDNNENEFAVMSAITDRYIKYLRFYDDVNAGMSEKDAAFKAGVRFYQNDFLRDARLLSGSDLTKYLQKILDTELKMKSGDNSKIQIEKLLFYLCKPLGKT